MKRSWGKKARQFNIMLQTKHSNIDIQYIVYYYAFLMQIIKKNNKMSKIENNLIIIKKNHAIIYVYNFEKETIAILETLATYKIFYVELYFIQKCKMVDKEKLLRF